MFVLSVFVLLSVPTSHTSTTSSAMDRVECYNAVCRKTFANFGNALVHFRKYHSGEPVPDLLVELAADEEVFKLNEVRANTKTKRGFWKVSDAAFDFVQHRVGLEQSPDKVRTAKIKRALDDAMGMGVTSPVSGADYRKKVEKFRHALRINAARSPNTKRVRERYIEERSKATVKAKAKPKMKPKATAKAKAASKAKSKAAPKKAAAKGAANATAKATAKAAANTMASPMKIVKVDLTSPKKPLKKETKVVKVEVKRAIKIDEVKHEVKREIKVEKKSVQATLPSPWIRKMRGDTATHIIRDSPKKYRQTTLK